MSATLSTLDDLVSFETSQTDANLTRKPKHSRGKGAATDLTLRMLRKAFPAALNHDLKHQRKIVVIIEPPGPDWFDLVHEAAREVFRPGDFHCVRGNQKDKDKEIQEVALRSAAATGQSLIVVTDRGFAGLAPAILLSADYHLQVQHPTRTMLAATLRAVSGESSITGIPADVGRASPAAALLAAIRRNENAKRSVERLRELHRRNRAGVQAILSPGPTLSELSGYGAAKQWGLEVAADIQAYRNGQIEWSELNSAAILHGLPGCGKTYFASALARSCGVPMVSTSLGQIFGQTAGYLDSVIKGLDAAFSEARGKAPAVLFIDELDALPDRNTLTGRGRDWWTTVVNHFLKLMDDGRRGVIALAATNMLSRIDPAVLRAGRFELHFEIGLPDFTELTGIFRHHLGSRLTDAETENIARVAQGSTAAQVAFLVKSAIAQARREQRDLRAQDLVQLLVKSDLSEEEMRRACIHEAGHALATIAVGRKVELVSMLQNGDRGGVVVTDGPGRLSTRERLEDQAVICLGGRNAEILLLGAASTGALQDIASATQTIAAIHSAFGLGATITQRAQLAKVTELLVEPDFCNLVETELQTLDARCMKLLASRLPELRLLAETLQSKRVISADEIGCIVRP